MKKRAQCMAAGGVVDSVEERLRRMNEKYGLPAPAEKKPPQAQQAPTQKPAPSREDAARPTLPESIRNRNDQLQQIMDYDRKFASGGIPRFRFKGKGGPRDDEIPVKVAGEKIKVSDGEEALILPAKTAKNPQAVAAIGNVIEQTNDGRKPAMGVEMGGKYAGGAMSGAKYYSPAALGQPDNVEEPVGGVWKDIATDQIAKAQAEKAQSVATPTNAMPQTTPLISAQADRDIAIRQPVAQAPKTTDIGGGVRRIDAPGQSTLFTNVGSEASPTASAMASNGVSNALTSGGVDSYGNSTVRTEQLRGQLAQMQAENGPAQQGIGEARWAAIPTATQSERAAHDRFNQFVRESNFNSLARDLATGGGNARTNAGKIAALAAMGADIRGAQNNQTANDVARGRDQTQRAVTEESGRTQRDVAGMQGQNQMAVESMRQNSPASRVLEQKAHGEIADAAAMRNARNELAEAADSGDQASYERAKRKAMAFGIMKPTTNEFQIQTDPMGQAYRLNKNTGSADAYDRQANTWKSIGAAENRMDFASEAEFEKAVNSGKVKHGQPVSINGRPLKDWAK